MADLRWSWLAAPYVVTTALILAVSVTAALIRGDRVMRLGVVAASSSAVPWSMCQGLAALTDDPETARHLIKLGQGPVVAVGPMLMLVMLGVSGQLERYRWILRIGAIICGLSFIVCWGTSWVVPGVQKLPSGMFYMAPGPLTGFYLSQLLAWLGVGLVLQRRATPRGERKRTFRLLMIVLVVATIGSMDTLLLYRIWGVYPIAWLSACVAAVLALYLVLKTDILRPQGFDRSVALEMGLFLASTVLTVGLTILLGTSSPLPVVTLSAIGWALMTGLAWASARRRRTRVKGERELERFMARVPTFEDEKKISEKLGALWQNAVSVDLTTLWWRDGASLTNHEGTRWRLDRAVNAWLVQNNEPLIVVDLATMRVGMIRPDLESLAAAHDADVIVPLVDRGELIGLVEAKCPHVLREADRGLIADSGKAAARALTFVGLARAANRERETARQVEVADALRLQASASRETELGRWAVAAEYRTAPRSTGAGWQAIELGDGRLALLVTEAQAHGVAAALATAALTGAFAAATASGGPVTLDEILRTMRASSEGVLRGGEPVAAFLAILDGPNSTIDWACAGHPGAMLIGPLAAVEAGLPAGSLSGPRPKAKAFTGGPRVRGASLHAARRGQDQYFSDYVLVVASTALRGDDDVKWEQRLLEVAPASGRIASVLVTSALEAGEPAEDLLAVVVRSR
ncbi:MAG TPA: SpoIIE family protein phosphatase [Kofleriaceae bacterium]|nr:SpoIIE family protein phosphatase [Kofleriaceae bacterium]